MKNAKNIETIYKIKLVAYILRTISVKKMRTRELKKSRTPQTNIWVNYTNGVNFIEVLI